MLSGARGLQCHVESDKHWPQQQQVLCNSSGQDCIWPVLRLEQMGKSGKLATF